MQKIADFISEHALFTKEDTLLVGFSGGADSVVLLHLLTEMGYACEAAHVNFQLRGNASDEDARFCKEFCAQRNIPFHLLTENAKTYAKTKKISIEMAARDIRYSWFEYLLLSQKPNCVVVAHHKNDQAETILMNMVRGTGVSGMKGMLPKNGNLTRPLLCLTRNEIEDYAKKQGLSYCTDESNSDTFYKRNKIRHKIIPVIESLNPSFVENISSFSRRFTESEVIVASYIQQWKTRNMVDKLRIPVDALWNDAAAATLLHGILSDYSFSPASILEIFHAFPFHTGARFFSDKYYLLYDRGFLLVEPLSAGEQLSPVDEREVYPKNRSAIKLHTEVLPAKAIESIPKEAYIACLDLDTLPKPLYIRKWREGDRFRPIGMKGFKKVSDFLTDNKLNLTEKQNIQVVASGDTIAWIVGHRIDDRFKISDKTKQVLWIELVEVR